MWPSRQQSLRILPCWKKIWLHNGTFANTLRTAFRLTCGQITDPVTLGKLNDALKVISAVRLQVGADWQRTEAEYKAQHPAAYEKTHDVYFALRDAGKSTQSNSRFASDSPHLGIDVSPAPKRKRPSVETTPDELLATINDNIRLLVEVGQTLRHIARS